MGVDAARAARDRILREHAELRGCLDEIDALLTRLEGGLAAAVGPLCERGLALYERLRAHIDLEDRILAPALRAQGEAGARLAEELEREHEEQRELLAFLGARLAQPRRPTELVVRELASFVAYLREDMTREEGTLELHGDDARR
jgi:hemerythrin-like domain-containing protein